MRHLMITITLTSFLFTSEANAVAPYEMEIGVMTEAELKDKYPVVDQGISDWVGGPVYTIDPEHLNATGIDQATVILNREFIVVAVILDLPKSSFERYHSYTAEKYNLISKDLPFVGDQKAYYSDGTSQIWLEAPHMGFGMQIKFLDETFIEAFNAGKKTKLKELEMNEKTDLFGE